ncbi:MAG TPA: DUF721 domain-containing protein [Myxococcales bacterium]|nr:DUF721 domain-containing protein [Myxococcales bacterium]
MRLSSAAVARRDLQSLKSLLPDVLAKVARESGRARHLWPLWREAVGGPIAQAARPVSLENGVLVVRVPTADWAKEIQRQEAEIVSRLAEKLGAGVVRSLRAAVAPEEPGPT